MTIRNVNDCYKWVYNLTTKRFEAPGIVYNWYDDRANWQTYKQLITNTKIIWKISIKGKKEKRIKMIPTLTPTCIPNLEVNTNLGVLVFLVVFLVFGLIFLFFLFSNNTEK